MSSPSSLPISLTLSQLESIISSSPQYNLIPVYTSITADLLTPVSAFLKIKDGKYSFLLESVEGGERLARYSFIGTSPYHILSQSHVDPLIAIEQELSKYKIMPVPELPSFTGGGVGYLSYDCIQYFEKKVKIEDSNPLNLPDSFFLFCDQLVVFDHVQHSIKLVTHIRTHELNSNISLQTLYTQAISQLHIVAQRLSKPLQEMVPIMNYDTTVVPGNPTVTSNVGQHGYESFVSSLKHHIRQGDIIQAVPSQRLTRPLRHGISAFDIYRQLRIVNPSPYMFYLELDEFYVVGASPEQLTKIEHGKVTTHPIAGTRKRGKNEQEDLALAAELLANEKERAEHIMLVDLGRNDVGRVSTPGTVKVDSLMQIERYSHVMHIVSQVSGQLAADKTIYDAFRAIFPAGTVSGAPKIRAMQLVSGLEKSRRGIYAGAVGYISFAGVLDTAIAIRTMLVRDGVAYLQAGGGIVYDSDPTEEYEETMNKMRAPQVAIDKAEQVAASHARTRALNGTDDTTMNDSTSLIGSKRRLQDETDPSEINLKHHKSDPHSSLQTLIQQLCHQAKQQGLDTSSLQQLIATSYS